MLTLRQPPVRPLRADARRNRDAIVAAADELFRVDGVAFQMDAVAQRAGLGVGTLYRHFPNKEDLLAQLVNNRFEAALAEAEAALAEEDSAVAVRMFFGGVLKIVQQDPGIMMALGGGLVDGTMEQCAFNEAELRDRKLALITRAQADGAIRPDLTIDDFGALMYGMTHAMQAGADGDLLIEVLLEGLRVPRECRGAQAERSAICGGSVEG